MRPEDVMKALELCIASRPKCKDCPYFIGGIRCKHSKLLRDAIALLREKDAEIARLTEENERLRKSRSIFAPIRDFTAEEIEQIAKEMLEGE